MNFNFNSGYGRILMEQIASSVGPIIGRIFIVVSASDNSIVRDMMREIVVPDPKGQIRFFETLEAAYAATTSNANDVIVLAGHSTHSVADGIAWTKSRVHVIGMDGGDRLIQQGAKVQLAGDVATAYVLKDTGTRNSFRNIKFIQASTNAAALTVLQLGGEGTLFKNVSATFGVVDNLDSTSAHEVVCGTDSATFINCEFGTETLLSDAVRTVFLIDQVVTSQEFKSNRFVDCNFIISTTETTSTLIATAAATDVLFTNLFKNCTLVASVDSAGGVALAVAAKTTDGLVKGTLNFYNCVAFACTNFASDAVGNDGLYVYGAASTGTDLVGVLATAT